MKPYFIDDNEKIVWQGKPNKLMYLFNGFSILAFIFLAFWAFLVISIGRNFIAFSSESRRLGVDPGSFLPGPFDAFSLIPYIFLVIIVFIFVIYPLKRLVESFKVTYYVTDLRVYIESGIIGKDIQNIEYKEINKLNVNVDLLGKILNRGTISLTPDHSYHSGDNTYTIKGIKLIGVEDPYNLYKLIKKNALDVSSDQQYPNAYRPDKNTGYNTRLDRKD